VLACFRYCPSKLKRSPFFTSRYLAMNNYWKVFGITFLAVLLANGPGADFIFSTSHLRRDGPVIRGRL
jgi:nucleoside recognition membrane protein YjiH